MRRNNKALYEQIMRNVSREVKKALNEWNALSAEEDYDDSYNELTTANTEEPYTLSLEDSLNNLVKKYLGTKYGIFGNEDYNGNLLGEVVGAGEPGYHPGKDELTPLYDKCASLCKKRIAKDFPEVRDQKGEFWISITKTYNIIISYRYELIYYCNAIPLKRINTPCKTQDEFIRYFEDNFLK